MTHTWRDAFNEARAIVDETPGASWMIAVLLWLAICAALAAALL